MILPACVCRSACVLPYIWNCNQSKISWMGFTNGCLKGTATIEPPSIEPPSIEPPTIEPPTIDPPTIDPPTIDPSEYTLGSIVSLEPQFSDNLSPDN